MKKIIYILLITFSVKLSAFEVKELSSNPRIYLLENFLSAEECDHIIKEANTKLVRSAVVDSETGEDAIDISRTSQGMDFSEHQDMMLSAIEARISNYTKISKDHGEVLQVLNYGVGAQFTPHFDYFQKELPGHVVHLEQAGQRVVTLIMYLNDVEEGGATVFHKANVEVKPAKGRAVLFYNCTPDGKEDPLTLHSGSPVRKGEKWIMTKWLREKSFFEGETE